MAQANEDSIRGRVSAIVKSHPGMAFCNSCLQEMLGGGNRSIVAYSASLLAKGGNVLGFKRSIATRGVCGKKLMVIYAIDVTQAGWNALTCAA